MKQKPFSHWNKVRVIAAAMIAAILIFIWGNSMMKAESSAEVSTGLLKFLQSFPIFQNLSFLKGGLLRKMAHLVEFSVLGGALYWAHRGKICRSAHLLTGLLAALIDETIQLFSANRSAQIQDVWIDFAGFCLGSAIVWGIFRRIYKKRGHE